MFGQQNDKNENEQISDQSIEAAMQDAPAVVATDDNATDTPAPAAPAEGSNQSWQHPGMPIGQAQSTTVSPAVSKPSYTAPNSEDPSYAANDLIDIKQKALQQLSPLVGHLDQSPEEKFRTTMMMIQASDDQTLVKDAYEAAGKIEDEKARAQALLDIVNEINYFTTQHEA